MPLLVVYWRPVTLNGPPTITCFVLCIFSLPLALWGDLALAPAVAPLLPLLLVFLILRLLLPLLLLLLLRLLLPLFLNLLNPKQVSQGLDDIKWMFRKKLFPAFFGGAITQTPTISPKPLRGETLHLRVSRDPCRVQGLGVFGTTTFTSVLDFPADLGKTCLLSGSWVSRREGGFGACEMKSPRLLGSLLAGA